jgi:hypothetical protein
MDAMTALLLSRTCNLNDFPGCITVAAWQERLAHHAWTQWLDAHHILTREQSIVDNYSGAPFAAPGPSALYRYPGSDNGVERAVPAVFGLCVLDKVEAPVSYLQRAATILRPQGLLFLTFTFWDAEGEDVASGHELRQRIYSAHSWQRLIRDARRAGFKEFGGHDWYYYGNKLDDHSLASLVLTRR